MVAFELPELPRRVLPQDWHATSFWHDTVASLAAPIVGDASTQALRSVFDDEWVSSIPDEPHDPHPFEYWYARGGGVPKLLRLGDCLAELGDVPIELRRRLRRRVDFDAAESEVRAGALLHRAGAEIDWIQAGRSPAPEFFAVWGTDRVPVEVKQLGDGARDRELGVVDAAFDRGLMSGLKDALKGCTTEPSSTAVLSEVLDELKPLAELEDPAASARDAERLGAGYGNAWGSLVRSGAAPGRYHPRPGLVVEVRPDGARQHAWEARTLSPGACVDYARLAGNALRKANTQICATGFVGIAVIERRWPPRWAPGVRGLVGRLLEGERYPGVGAVFMREAELAPGASRTAEIIHVLPGLAWNDLPTAAQSAFPPGSHRIDLRGARRDDFELQRASSPEQRFAEACKLMRVGYGLQWSRLRREHPDASDEQLTRVLREWSERA